MSEMPNLELRITDNAEQTVRSLGSLASSLTRIQKAIDRGLNLDQAGHAVNRLGKIIENSFSTSAEQSIQSLRRLSNAIVRIQKTVNTGMRLNEAGTEIREFGSTIGTALGDSSVQAVKSLGTLANSLSKVQKLINSGLNLSKAGEEIKKFGLTIENAFGGIAKGSGSQAITGYAPYDQYISSLNGNKQVNVESYEKAVNMLSSFAKSLNRVQKVIGDGLKLGEVGSKIEQFGQSVGRSITDDVVARYERFAEAVSKIKGIKLPTISNPLAGTDLETALNKRVQFALGNGKERASLIKQFTREVDAGLAKGTLDDSQVQIYQNAIDGLVQTERALDSAQIDTNQKTQDAAPAAREAAESTKTFRDRLKELFTTMSTGKHHSNGLLSAFVRIAKYRFLRTVIKEITDGFKMGLSNMYEYAKAIGHTFAPAVDSAQNALFKMKNSLGAALAPVLQMIIPYVVQLVQLFINLINVVNQFFALLRGQTTWTRATDAAASSMDKVKASTAGVGQAAKEAQKEVKGLLADWDELNIIQQDTGDNGGGGSGSGGGASGYLPTDYESMFEEVDVFDDRIKNIVRWIKDHLDIIKSLVIGIGLALLAWKLSNGFTSGLLAGIKNLLKFVKLWVGLSVAVYGAIIMYRSFVDQWNNGIDWGNVKTMIAGASIVVLGLGIAFGKLGLGWGLLAVGIALIVNPLKELITTGELSEPAMFQLALGIGAVAAGIAILRKGSILTVARDFLGLAVAAYAAAQAYKEVKEQWGKGINWENFKKLYLYLKLLAGGLLLAFGIKGLGIGELIAGLTELIAPMKELREAGWDLKEMSDEAFTQMQAGLMDVGIGLSLLTGTWIPAAITGLGAVVLDVIRNWDKIVEEWDKSIKTLKNIGVQIVYKLAEPFIKAFNGIIDAVNNAITSINKFAGTDLPLINWSVSLEQFRRDLGLADDKIKETESDFKGIVITPEYEAKYTAEVIGNKGLIKSIQDALNDIDNSGFRHPFEKGNFDNYVSPYLDQLIKNAGIQDAEIANRIKENFYDAWEQQYKNPEWDKTYNNLMKWLVNGINSNGGKIEIPVIDGITESAESATEALEGANEQLEKLKNATVPVEAAVTAAEDSEETVTFEVPEQEPVVIDVPVSYNIVSDETSADAGAVEYEYDTGDIEALTEKIREALNNSKIETSDPGALAAFWNNTIQDSIDEIGKAGGLDNGAIEALSDTLYDDWLAALANDDWDGSVQGIMDKIKQAISEPSEWNIPSVNDSGIVNGLSGTATNIESFVGRIRGAIKSLDGLSFNFSGGLMGGGFKVVMPAMAAEGGMFTTGQMFIARERGPEIVGTMNGKSTVANNNQIVSGISAGVATANQEEVRTLNRIEALLNRIEKKEFAAKVVPSSGFGKDVRRSLDMYARNTGVSG